MWKLVVSLREGEDFRTDETGRVVTSGTLLLFKECESAHYVSLVYFSDRYSIATSIFIRVS